MANPSHPNSVPERTEVFDVLVAGGGPGGTAVAFRATELGLRTLVVEYDDLMKRIRDYSKSKLILPGFGGGDKLKFPKGGELIDALRFGPIDKDAMCLEWKALYEKGHVQKEIGLELTGLKKRADDCYQVKCWNHNTRTDQFLLARHVVLALGNGVPRRLDVPGDTEGIAFRLRDPNLYVGEPACVIGGGTSAAEAVIAISQAKVAAGDPSSVFWSYRGDRLPKVSKALADVFFDAYMGNGNIRYFPKSEPASIVTHSDQRSYLSIRVDRRKMDGRPSETSHLEFPKEQCLACIGQDLPEQLLADLGIALVRGGPRNKKRIVVNQYLESCQPNVYMVGDLLSQAYLCTDDFHGDPAQFQEIKHRGNIKTALRDGVLVAEVIKQRIQGVAQVEVVIQDAADEEAVELVAQQPAAVVLQPSSTMRDSLPPISMKLDTSAMLHRLLPSGIVESEHRLQEGATTIGSTQCDVEFRDDPMLGQKHAVLKKEGDRYTLSCQDAERDIFIVLPPAQKRALAHGDLLRVGCQFLLVSSDQGRHWVNHYSQDGRELGTHFLTDKLMVFGRESPDVTLDAADMSLSRRHLVLAVEEGRIVAKDLKSANHSFLRLRQPIALTHGDRFQIGSKLFELHLGSADHKKPVPPIAPVQGRASSRDGSATVTFEGHDQAFPVAPGQTICDVAEAQGISIKAECHMGICGSDPIEVLSGKEFLVDEPGEGESETLEDICDLDPGKCRLACKARIKGPVVVRILHV